MIARRWPFGTGERSRCSLDLVVDILNLVGSLLFLISAILTFAIPEPDPPAPEIRDDPVQRSKAPVDGPASP